MKLDDQRWMTADGKETVLSGAALADKSGTDARLLRQQHFDSFGLACPFPTSEVGKRETETKTKTSVELQQQSHRNMGYEGL